MMPMFTTVRTIIYIGRVLEDRPRQRGGGGATLPAPFEPPPGHDELLERVRGYERVRTYLLPALVMVQEDLGWLPGWAIEFIGVHLRVPKSEVFGIASSFPDLQLTQPAQTSRVCRGASCRQRGGESPGDGEGAADCLFVCGVGPVVEVDGHVRAQSRNASVPAGAVVQDGTCTRAVFNTSQARDVRKVGCPGNCWQAPAWSTDGGTTWHSAEDTWVRPESERLLKDIGRREPLAERPYDALERALSMGSDAVWQLVKDSGLKGRGGAYFPVGAKWETARNTPSARKFLLVNAEEGEPGIYKDRHLLEGDPHRVLESIQIAALGIGATDVVIFLNGEARLSRDRLLAALERARSSGVVRAPTEVRLGAGGYVLGEETTLINVIHGLRAEPLARPPFPAVSGLRASPTVINNVESLTNLPDIVRFGSDWFRSVGTEHTPGTKLISLAGAVRKPGLYEVALGTTLKTIIDEHGAGTTKDIGCVLVGGPSGSILPPVLLDTPLDIQPLQAVGGVLGAGGIVPLTEDQCPVDAVRELVAYNARESCGKCTPCREGTPRMLHFFEDLRSADLEIIDELNDVLAFGSLCGLGQMAPNPVRALLRHFGEVVNEHVKGHCRTGTCAWS
jgi:NADH:ubiquinone oxidoreductase subunit F (NADH-binding)/NADH:ubiquinone oxidoreductase subunit E